MACNTPAISEATVHHFANVLFNSMRGGSFAEDHRVEVADVQRFIASRNRFAGHRFGPIANDLEPTVEIGILRSAVQADVDLAAAGERVPPAHFQPPPR